jgi:hypothetical protein
MTKWVFFLKLCKILIKERKSIGLEAIYMGKKYLITKRQKFSLLFTNFARNGMKILFSTIIISLSKKEKNNKFIKYRQ